MTAAEAKKLHGGLALTPAQRGAAWERDIQKMFMANRNSWHWFHLPRLATKALNKRLPANLPDYVAFGKIDGPKGGVMLSIEAKTGAGVQSEAQEEVQLAMLAVPGCVGGVFYPHERAELLSLIGVDYV